MINLKTLNKKNYSNLINLDIIKKTILKSIELEGCESLKDIISMVENIDTLKYLNLKYYKKIKNISINIHHKSF